MALPKILIVDDNALNIELASFVLGNAGMAVVTAGDAVQALVQIAKELPDLILMDVQMPGMDGLELTRRLRAQVRTRDIVIVAFTAYAMRGDEARMRAAGCDGYVSKPIDVARFAEQVLAFAAAGRGNGHD